MAGGIQNDELSDKTSGFYEDFFRSAPTYEVEMQSTSSLSWGEDELEGEATKIVTLLFEQLDKAFYGDTEESAYFPVPREHAKVNDKSVTLKEEKLVRKKSKFKASNLELSASQMSIECSSWKEYFPHFRICGHSVNPKVMEIFEGLCLPDLSEKCNTEGDEVSNGSYSHLLSFVSLNSSNALEKEKKSTTFNQIYNAAGDLEMLKEQVLIMLFDKVWAVVSEVIEPVVEQYTETLFNNKNTDVTNDFNLPALEFPVSKPMFRSYFSNKLIKRELSRPSFSNKFLVAETVPVYDELFTFGAKTSLLNITRHSSAGSDVSTLSLPSVDNEFSRPNSCHPITYMFNSYKSKEKRVSPVFSKRSHHCHSEEKKLKENCHNCGDDDEKTTPMWSHNISFLPPINDKVPDFGRSSSSSERRLFRKDACTKSSLLREKSHNSFNSTNASTNRGMSAPLRISTCSVVETPHHLGSRAAGQKR